VFKRPIETIVLDAAGNLTFDNIEGARNYGAEFEVRLGLERLAEALEPLSLSANFAWIFSRVTLSDEERGQATSQRRPMAGQSPYVANVSLGYSDTDTGLSLNLFYNVFGRRIVEVGRQPFPDVYEEPVHSVDLTASYKLTEQLKIGASGTNLLRQPIPVEQGEARFSNKNEGIGFGVSIGYAN
jgi:outer membrane receptor protein involved in Fe transport